MMCITAVFCLWPVSLHSLFVIGIGNIDREGEEAAYVKKNQLCAFIL